MKDICAHAHACDVAQQAADRRGTVVALHGCSQVALRRCTECTRKVMDHFSHPRNVGELPNPDGVGQVGIRLWNIMRVESKVDDGIISDIRFKTFGCGAAIATSSMATEMVKGKSLAGHWRCQTRLLLRPSVTSSENALFEIWRPAQCMLPSRIILRNMKISILASIINQDR